MLEDPHLYLAACAATELVPVSALARMLEQGDARLRGFGRETQRTPKFRGIADVRTLDWPVDGLPVAPIASFAGIDQLRSIETLRLRAVAESVDPEPLGDLRTLRELVIAGGIANVRFVARLRELHAVELAGPIDDLAPFAGHPVLDTVSLAGLVAEDVAPLGKLGKLAQLRLRWADGAPGPSRDAAQTFVDSLPATVELDVEWPCGEIKPNRPRRARNRELEAAIRADPEDPAAYLVYADWLQAQNDPLGALIVYDHALAELPTPELAELRAQHFATHRARILNRLPDRDAYSWRLGYLRRADVDDPDELDALMRTPAALFLTSLRIRVIRMRMMEAITRGVAPPLRELELVAQRTLHLDASSLWKRYPELRRVVLDGAFDPGAIALPHATRVEIRGEDGALRDRALVAIDGASWPKLEELTVAGLFDQVPRSILEATGTPHLRRLRLEARWADPICVALAGARVLGQLTELEIVSPDGVGNEGARALLAARSRWAHLDVFDVGIGRVNRADAHALAALIRPRT